LVEADFRLGEEIIDLHRFPPIISFHGAASALELILTPTGISGGIAG
jgi:hypothetical protein